jgi:hypothetical protein
MLSAETVHDPAHQGLSQLERIPRKSKVVLLTRKKASRQKTNQSHPHSVDAIMNYRCFALHGQNTDVRRHGSVAASLLSLRAASPIKITMGKISHRLARFSRTARSFSGIAATAF